MDLPSAEQAIVGQLMRETALTAVAIAERTGIAAGTIRTWNRRFGWREIAGAARRRLDPASWTPARRLAVARLYETPGIETATLAVALGGTVRTAPALFRACGFARRRLDPGTPAAMAGIRRPALPSTLELERILRDHIARQIARFDEALRDDPAPALDSAKVLRDLGGLKRLLDDISAGERERAHATSDAPSEGDAVGNDELPALRAAIAARYATCLGERADAGLPGEPAAAPDPGPCLGLAP